MHTVDTANLHRHVMCKKCAANEATTHTLAQCCIATTLLLVSTLSVGYTIVQLCTVYGCCIDVWFVPDCDYTACMHNAARG